MTEPTKLTRSTVLAIVATGLMSFCGVIVETAMNITFPTLMTEFHVTTSTVQWLTTVYLLVVAALVPLSATLKRRFAAKHLFLVAISFFILGVVLDGTAPSFWVLLLGRAIQGLGTGIALPLMFNIILEQVPRPLIGTMMGVGTMITGVAPAIGPTFGGVVVATLGWRYVFVFLLPVLVLSLVLGVTCIHQVTKPVATPLDPLSVALISLTFAGLIYGLANMGASEFWRVQVAGALLVGVLALVAFVWRSGRVQAPILNLHLFANRRFTAWLIAFACLQTAALSLSFLLPNAIQLVNHHSALIAGLVVLPGAALGAIAGPLSGRLLDRLGARLPLRLGAIIVLAGVVGLLATPRLGDFAILVWYAVFMLGMGLSYGNLMTSGLNTLAAPDHPDGNAIFNTAQQFFAAVGTSLAASLVAGAQAQAAVAVGTAAGTRQTLVVLVILAGLETALAWVLTRPKHLSA
ncbi:MFS transporter [Lacticaseibacillus parakribbianus]|uniref:MFS transporter n=1 Tax=Lacticaseibacillus parakribbianus TaxID=2970927 RepID=UPI0021CB5A33|nr:MFS transporter [Lacticaseibacillus parakribbianus]